MFTLCMLTSGAVLALSGVYKLASDWPRMKIQHSVGWTFVQIVVGIAFVIFGLL